MKKSELLVGQFYEFTEVLPKISAMKRQSHHTDAVPGMPTQKIKRRGRLIEKVPGGNKVVMEYDTLTYDRPFNPADPPNTRNVVTKMIRRTVPATAVHRVVVDPASPLVGA